MAAQMYGELPPASQISIYDRLTDITSLVLRTVPLTDSPGTDLDVLLARVGSLRAMLDNLRSEIVAGRGA